MELGDIEDFDRLDVTVKKYRPEVIFHLAGQALVSAAIVDPRGTFQSNVLGTVNVLDSALRSNSVRAVVLMGTPGESSVIDGATLDPYTASKCANTAIAAGYSHPSAQRAADRSDPLGITVARPGVILGGDWNNHRLLPDVVRAIQSDQPIVMHNPNAVRPWQHVLDAAAGVLELGRIASVDVTVERTYDIGKPHFHPSNSVSRVVSTFLRYWGAPNWPVEFTDEDSGGSRTSPSQMSSAESLSSPSGWRPTWDLDRTLYAAAAWYKSAVTDVDSLPSLTDSQIRQYVHDMRSQFH